MDKGKGKKPADYIPPPFFEDEEQSIAPLVTKRKGQAHQEQELIPSHKLLPLLKLQQFQYLKTLQLALPPALMKMII